MSEELLLVGDSVTVGSGFSGVDDVTCYVSLLRAEFEAAGVDMQLQSSALDGADTAYVLRRFDRMVARMCPDVLVISLGLNDACPPGRRRRNTPAEYTANLERLTERAFGIDVRPILCTPPPRLDVCRDGQPAWKTMQPYAEGARQVADRYHLPLIELYDEFVARDDLASLLPDRLHPGRVGHRIIARQFARTLLPLCAGRSMPAVPARRHPHFEFVTAD